MGFIQDIARRDTAQFIKSGGFETELTFTKETETFNVSGIAIKRTDDLEYENGSFKTEKFSRIIVIIADLPASFKNNDLIIVDGWSVSFLDSEGYEASYKLKDSFPNKTLGLLSVNISNAKSNSVSG